MRRLPTACLVLLLLAPGGVAAQEPAKAAPDSVKTPPAEEKEAPVIVKLQQEVYWAPPGAGNDGFTWIKLKSGEWQRGEIKDLHNGTLTFDSDELGTFTYDWDDVHSLVSGRPHTITTWEPSEVHTGFIVARQGSISIHDENGAVTASVDPHNVSSMIQGQRRERNYWSGSVGLNTTIRVGNSDQTDASVSIELSRHALFTRWENMLSANYGTSGGQKTQETQRCTSTFDWFVSRRWFVTMLGYEYYRDPFQNIAQRHIPGAGGGYTRDLGSADWDLTALLAWQGVQYVSVQEGEPLTDESVTWRVETSLDWEITGDVDYDLDYSINFPVGDVENYTSNLVSKFSVDLFHDLDLDLTVEWDRQSKPRQSEDGSVPKKDDLRFSTGISWEF